MAIATALVRPLVPRSPLLRSSYLSWSSTSAQRPASSAVRPPSPKRQARKPKPIKRFVPDEVKKFVKPDGKLLTTPQNRDFLLQHGLEPDNGRMTLLHGGPELSRAASDFSAMLAYSPRHIIHPFDLRYFEPRGHPLAPMKRAKYAHKTRHEPMWIMVSCAGNASAVVRTLTRRRLTRCIYEALHGLGYRAGSRNGEVSKVWGTLWVVVHDPVKAATQSPERFGRVVADALVKNCRT
ncbi:uncharacterized protein MAM_03230 [Metarhizium album ARSEF 1941]|uniref:Uncharacterized protein n=1 Tax=Metarhizium album (strain ARSEF 1941) TaxID=1081103 RepID=A0A0B2WXM7_METAS|nr:uncharacterized protein MAM_03230 [Metarhizium album ARSEF 1941]KHN98768.1 hypothetical protein MAM_03230 [Metarhizium album ARSEF 1941]